VLLWEVQRSNGSDSMFAADRRPYGHNQEHARSCSSCMRLLLLQGHPAVASLAPRRFNVCLARYRAARLPTPWYGTVVRRSAWRNRQVLVHARRSRCYLLRTFPRFLPSDRRCMFLPPSYDIASQRRVSSGHPSSAAPVPSEEFARQARRSQSGSNQSSKEQCCVRTRIRM
jgi:hypothetical protein